MAEMTRFSAFAVRQALVMAGGEAVERVGVSAGTDRAGTAAGRGTAAPSDLLRGKRLPKGRAVPADELEYLLRHTSSDPRPLAVRDAAIIHTLYATGMRRSELVNADFADLVPARAVVYGHTHRLLCDQLEEPWVLNPGAAGQVRTFGGPSCLVLHAEPLAWHVESIRFPPLK